MSDDPNKSSHRFIATLMSTFHGGEKVSPLPSELDRISDVFKRAGGSWVGVFQGSTQDIVLLKKVVKVAISKSLVTKTPCWDGKS